MIIPLLDEDTVFLVREYSVGMDEYVLIFPKRAIEGDEDILVTAERELKEEVGYGSRDMSVIAAYSASPGYLHSKMDIILAKDLYRETMVGDGAKPLELISWKLSQMEELLARLEFHKGRNVAALFLVEGHQRGSSLVKTPCFIRKKPGTEILQYFGLSKEELYVMQKEDRAPVSEANLPAHKIFQKRANRVNADYSHFIGRR